MKCLIIPAIIGAAGIVRKGLKKNLEAIPGKHSTDSLQMAAVLGTSHIIRKVLQSDTRSQSGGDHRWFKRIIIFINCSWGFHPVAVVILYINTKCENWLLLS